MNKRTAHRKHRWAIIEMVVAVLFFSTTEITLARIQEITPASRPMVIYIQEPHVNAEAQQQLVVLLQRLIAQRGLRLILVEGGYGDVSLTPFVRGTTLERRQQVAQVYLQSGLLSGEEYLNVVSNAPLTLWGVEDRRLYDENVQALLSADTVRQRVRPIVERWHHISGITGQASELVNLLERCVNLRLAADEYQRLRSALSAPTRHGLDTLPDWRIVEAALPQLMRFYDIARARDEALANNTLAKLADTQDRIVVLITGGFHSTGIMKRLVEQGVGVIGVELAGQQPINDERYYAVLKYKQALEKVFTPARKIG